jgi:predicted secreted acid phosphatase
MKKCLLLILLSGLFCAAFAQNEQNTPASIANNGKVWASLYIVIPNISYGDWGNSVFSYN